MISRKDGGYYNRRVEALVGYHFDDVLVHTAERDAPSAQTDHIPPIPHQTPRKDARHGVRRPSRNRVRALLPRDDYSNHHPYG